MRQNRNLLIWKCKHVWVETALPFIALKRKKMKFTDKAWHDVGPSRFLPFEPSSNFLPHQNAAAWKSTLPQWGRSCAARESCLRSVLLACEGRAHSSPQSLALSKSRMVKSMQSLIKHKKRRGGIGARSMLAHFRHQTFKEVGALFVWRKKEKKTPSGNGKCRKEAGGK